MHLAVQITAFIVATLAVGRVTRLLYYDSFPPIESTRLALINLTNRREWSSRYTVLWTCPWCLSFWVALADVLWAWGTDLSEPWWWVNLTFALAYAAPILIARDEPDTD